MIQDSLKAHYEYVCQHYHKQQILGVFLYGSQNYNTDTPASDIDTKAIYIPTLEELAFNKPVSKELVLPNDEHCEVKDIREMIKNFKKQNINFLEVLFTKHYIINPKYEQLWNEYFIANREKIARYDVNAAVKSMTHQAIHTLNQDPTNPKKVSNALRLLYFLEGYIRQDDYMSCLCSYNNRAEILRNIKEGKYEGLGLLSNVISISLEEYKRADLKHLTDPFNKNHVDTLLNEACIKMIKLII